MCMCVYAHIHLEAEERESKGLTDWGVGGLRNNPLKKLWVLWAGLSERDRLTLRSGLGIRSSSISEGNRERIM